VDDAVSTDGEVIAGNDITLSQCLEHFTALEEIPEKIVSFFE
jgi:hypothetical protein